MATERRGFWQDLPHTPPDYAKIIEDLHRFPFDSAAAVNYVLAKYSPPWSTYTAGAYERYAMRREPAYRDAARQSNWYGPPNGTYGTQPGWEYGPWGDPDEPQYGLTFRDWRGFTRCRITAEFLRLHDTAMVYVALQRRGVPFPDLHILDSSQRIGNTGSNRV